MPLKILGFNPNPTTGGACEAEQSGRVHAGDLIVSADGISLLG